MELALNFIGRFAVDRSAIVSLGRALQRPQRIPTECVCASAQANARSG